MTRRNSAAKYPCTECNENVGDTDKSLSCMACKQWAHYKCIGISEDCYDLLHKEKSKLIQFVCNKCDLSNIIKEWSASKNKKKDSIPADSSVDSKLSGLEEKLNKKFDNLCDILKPLLCGVPNSGIDDPQRPNLDNRHSPSYASVAAKNVTPGRIITVGDFKEIQTQELDSRSVVVSGLAEEGHDLHDASELCNFLDSSVRVVEVFRLGNLSRGGESGSTVRPRLLKVILASSTVARSILTESVRLKDTNLYRGVFIRRSMPREERILLGKIRAKCKALNASCTESSDSKYVIVKEKILKYINCTRDGNGSLGKGVLDKNFKFSVENGEIIISDGFVEDQGNGQ